ncbi:MAG: PPOX class F420-dependent oxidoreductase [Gordonia sp. (in: high G+C Gram-positive bacteria)]|uniref:pyridoxamine 5'-phosphate oxidase family protein n=1 Tax=Gordonia sp. (in: high G+C Gram-positive bacteria) TaxID=84139 RepID=UPI0039E7173A
MGNNQRDQIVMSDDEITDFLHRSRTATLATIGRDGRPHLVAMWYGVVESAAGPVPEIWFETKSKSQKAVNLRRDPRVTVLVEDGLTYDELRGVSIEGDAVVYDDAEHCLAAGINVWERYNGPYSEELRPAVEAMMHKRVAVRVVPRRVRSWDHRKLNLPDMPLTGSTAEYHA